MCVLCVGTVSDAAADPACFELGILTRCRVLSSRQQGNYLAAAVAVAIACVGTGEDAGRCVCACICVGCETLKGNMQAGYRAIRLDEVGNRVCVCMYDLMPQLALPAVHAVPHSKGAGGSEADSKAPD